MNDVQSDGYTGRANETTGTDEFNAATFLVNQVLSGKWTITLCLVKSVSGGGIGAPAIVSVQPMVNQVDGTGNPTPHGTINGIPAFRLQGGAGAFVADPAVNDIGILACASRDISTVKNNRAPANPGSQRTFDPADGMYIGSLLGAAPTQYVQITADGINIVFPGGISIALSSSGIVISAGSATIATSTDGTVKINGIDFSSHLHSGVQTGAGDSGPPVA